VDYLIRNRRFLYHKYHMSDDEFFFLFLELRDKKFNDPLTGITFVLLSKKLLSKICLLIQVISLPVSTLAIIFLPFNRSD
jgi:hypothetical protein